MTVPTSVGESLREDDAAARPRLPFRPDVEGLRAVAIGLVVGYHAGLPFLPGGFIGVDVFFVISGFLITGLLLVEVQRTGRVSLAAFWGRRARRLLPAAVLVLVLTAMVSWFVIPVIDHALVGGDVVASGVYVSNLRFAAQATDYLAADRSPSPVLHFWSLGVEEQFYLVWPLLMLVVVLLVARARRSTAAVVAGALLVVGAVSFVWSQLLTQSSQPWAFFGTPSRAWEFAVGGLIGIAACRGFVLPPVTRLVLGWGGLAVLAVGAVHLTADVAYPGLYALWPVVGTAMVLLAGRAPSAGASGGESTSQDGPGAHLLLTTWPMRAIGRLSYSWYLWHWPVLVLVAAAVGPLSVPVRCALVLAALVPAALSFRFVEQPVHHSASLAADPARSLLVGLALSLAAVAAGLALATLPGGGAAAADVVASVDETTGRAPAPLATGVAPRPSTSPRGSAPTAPALTPPATGSAITPDPLKARDDLPVTYGDGCHLPIAATAGGTCAFGDLASGTTIVLLGDSHAAQWFPALERVATARGWRLLSRTKSGCPAPDVTTWLRSLARAYTECDQWRSDTLGALTSPGTKPALVVAASTQTESLVQRGTGTRLSGAASQQEWRDGWGRTLARLSSAGVPVAVLRDTPWPGRDVAACVAQHLDDPATCDLGLAALAPPSSDIGTARGVAGATGVDLTSSICAPDRCPAVIGPLLVYRDNSHLTATFSRSLSARLAAALAPLLR